jgi:hypothetical protein
MTLTDLRQEAADRLDSLAARMRLMRPFRLWLALSLCSSLPFALYTGHLAPAFSQFFFMLMLWPLIVAGHLLYRRFFR